MRFALPLGIFILMVGLLGYGLGLDPKKVPSPLIDKATPTFSLARLHASQQYISNSDLLGEVWVLNVWASWCVACRTEHPILVEAVIKDALNLYGLNYKDKREDALQWLEQLGNPYIESAFDLAGTTGIDYGVYGVPETFILDKDGIIRYKHIGPVSKQQLEKIILPLVKQLESPKT